MCIYVYIYSIYVYIYVYILHTHTHIFNQKKYYMPRIKSLMPLSKTQKKQRW